MRFGGNVHFFGQSVKKIGKCTCLTPAGQQNMIGQFWKPAEEAEVQTFRPSFLWEFIPSKAPNATRRKSHSQTQILVFLSLLGFSSNPNLMLTLKPIHGPQKMAVKSRLDAYTNTNVSTLMVRARPSQPEKMYSRRKAKSTDTNNM